MRKIGIFSGTFDPIHEGHVMFAQTAMEHFGIDEILFLPEENPRRKDKASSHEHRSEMIELALRDFPGMRVFKVSHPQHTLLETMEEMVAEHAYDAQYVLLMGADVFENIESWKDFSEIAHDLAYVVALRTEDDGEIVIPLAEKLQLNAEFVPSPLSTISSSAIRSSVIEGSQPRGLNDDVESYISENNLYVAD